jgi:uncharacterized membrane protein
VTVWVRALHIAATCTSLGGLFYARMVLLPALAALPEEARAPLLRVALRRFAWIKWTGVAVVAVTGIVQWNATWPRLAAVPTTYIASFGLKMVGAAGLFAITFLLALPAERLGPMRRRRAFWSALNIACGAAILVGAALMRSTR